MIKRSTKIILVLLSLSLLCGIAAIWLFIYLPWKIQAMDGRLRQAVIEQDVERVRYLLNQGANPDGKMFGTKHNYTPMVSACEAGNLEILDMLVKAGGDPLLSYKSPGEQRDLMHFFLINPVTPEHAECITYLIEQGLDPNHHEKTGKGVPLSDFVDRQYWHAVTALVRGGAHVNIQKRDYGNTVLHTICSQPLESEVDRPVRLLAVQTILDAGYDLAIKNYSDETALDLAVKHKQTDLEKLIRDQMVNNPE